MWKLWIRKLWIFKNRRALYIRDRTLSFALKKFLASAPSGFEPTKTKNLSLIFTDSLNSIFTDSLNLIFTDSLNLIFTDSLNLAVMRTHGVTTSLSEWVRVKSNLPKYRMSQIQNQWRFRETDTVIPYQPMH
jgi:hypothetical protein